jgi:hypothetical protein
MTGRNYYIDIDPYVRVQRSGLIRWGNLNFNPWMARRLADRLRAAADRADPKHQSRAPWIEKEAEE